MSENGEIYSAGKNFTLLPALTAWTNSTSGFDCCLFFLATLHMKYKFCAFCLTKYPFKDLVTKFYVVFWAFIPCCRCGKISQKELRNRLIRCRTDAEEGQVQTYLYLSLCLFLFFGCQFSISYLPHSNCNMSC